VKFNSKAARCVSLKKLNARSRKDPMFSQINLQEEIKAIKPNGSVLYLLPSNCFPISHLSMPPKLHLTSTNIEIRTLILKIKKNDLMPLTWYSKTTSTLKTSSDSARSINTDLTSASANLTSCSRWACHMHLTVQICAVLCLKKARRLVSGKNCS